MSHDHLRHGPGPLAAQDACRDTFLLELRGIVKAFPNILANNGIDFDLRKHEIHALLGENGSGKSTLMKIAFGIYQPDAGKIRVRGQERTISDSHTATTYGIGMVHQHFMLVPSLTVLENLMLGFEMRRGPLLDRKRMEVRINALFQQIGLPTVPLNVLTSALSVGEQQRVEIVKAMLRGADILILDEPTAVLTPQEIEGLGQVLVKLRDEGCGIILITHKLDEVVRYADRVTVLRNGRRVDSRPVRGVDKAELANSMVGRELQEPELVPGRAQKGDLPILALESVSVFSAENRRLLDNVSVSVRAGEIVGIAGVAGNGQEAIAEVLAGLRSPQIGRVRIRGKPQTRWDVGAAIASGIGFIPEDRQTIGLILDFSVAENLILKRIAQTPFSRRGRLSWSAIRSHADALIDGFDIRPPLADRRVRTLSGGNQQKVILAREIAAENSVVVAAEPTRGLDVGSVDYIHRRLLEQRCSGRAVILISTDLDELIKLSDRIAVLYEGRILETLDRIDATREKLGLLMAGIREQRAV